MTQTPSRPVRKCKVCGCTEKRACYGGCAWDALYPKICTRCTSFGPFRAIEEERPSGSVFWVAGPGERQIPSYFGRDQAAQVAAALNRAWHMAMNAAREMYGVEAEARREST